MLASLAKIPAQERFGQQRLAIETSREKPKEKL